MTVSQRVCVIALGGINEWVECDEIERDAITGHRVLLLKGRVVMEINPANIVALRYL